jgi:AcrR family transcriptional regulator
MSRPRTLTDLDIATAALAVIDREGLVALSMRTVAGELNMGAMSLYRYVEGREALEQLVVELVLGKVDPARLAKVSWRERITMLAELIRAAISAHAAIVPLLMAHRHSSRSVMKCAEVFLRALTDGGFKGKRRVIALRTLISYVYGALQAQHIGPLPGAGTVALSELADTEYPLLAETARQARRIAPDEEFRSGLAIVMLGLEKMRSGDIQA